MKEHGIKQIPQKKNEPTEKKNLQSTRKVQQKLTTARVSRRIQIQKEKKVEMKKTTPKKEVSSVDDKISTINTEFECPVCNKTFPVFFSAAKHVQKKHNDAQNNEIKLKPIRIDKCTLCSERVEDEYHICSHDDNESGLSYKCLGCLRTFSTLAEFSMHIGDNHADNTDVMTFRTVHDFRTWKVNTEAQVNSRYSIFDKSTRLQYHHCNFVCSKNQKNITFLCPSVMVIKELSKTIDVQYFKNHYGHETPQYELRDEYKKNMVGEEDFETPKITQKTYLKFKSLMETIISDASSANLDSLKKLLTMAVKMQDYLNDDDEEMLSPLSKSMTDYQITKELEVKVNSRPKRRTDTPNNKGGKKIKSEIDDAFDSLLSPRSKSPPSFNDSYKQFIDSTTSTNRPLTKKGKKDDTIKTKIQFIPNPRKVKVKPAPENTKPNILRPSKGNISNVSDNGKGNNVDYEVREQENDCNILVFKI